MRSTVRLVVLLLLVPLLAWAQQTCDQYRVVYYDSNAGWSMTKAIACANAEGTYGTLQVTGAHLDASENCVVTETALGCTGACSTERTLPIAHQAGECSPCQAGQTSTKNVTTGWSRSPEPPTGSAYDTIVAVSVGNVGTSVCDGQCQWSVGPAVDAWQSKSPAPNGMYRISVDYQMTTTGQTCTAKTPSVDPNQPPPPCDGYQGQINGKTVCVGPQGSSDPTVQQQTPPKWGNPAAGSGGNLPQSGREPTGGDGGNGGGPPTTDYGDIRGGQGDPATPGAGSGAGGTPTVNVEFPEMPQPCGTPDGPACKIDETGTPSEADGKAKSEAGKQQLDAAAQSAIDAINSASNGTDSRKAVPWLPDALQLPSAGCTVSTVQTRLGALSLDLCGSELVAMWRQMLAWFMYLATVLYAWRRATDSTGG